PGEAALWGVRDQCPAGRKDESQPPQNVRNGRGKYVLQNQLKKVYPLGFSIYPGTECRLFGTWLKINLDPPATPVFSKDDLYDGTLSNRASSVNFAVVPQCFPLNAILVYDHLKG